MAARGSPKKNLDSLVSKTNWRNQKKKNEKHKLKSSRKKSINQSDVPYEEYDANERILRQFDMSMEYGPCMGISRLKRWERAKSFGLNPAQVFFDLLKSDNVQQESLFSVYKKFK